LPEVIIAADELKVIIYNKADFEWAESFAQQVKPTCKLYLQVEWEKRETITPYIVEYIKNNPKWALSVQTHKYIHVP
jgi:organic radical activating enzyme